MQSLTLKQALALKRSLTLKQSLELMHASISDNSIIMGVYTDDSYDEEYSQPADLLTDHRGTPVGFERHPDAASVAQEIRRHTSIVHVHPYALSGDEYYVFYVFATNEIRDAVYRAV
jgi:hypothetical protein